MRYYQCATARRLMAAVAVGAPLALAGAAAGGDSRRARRHCRGGALVGARVGAAAAGALVGARVGAAAAGAGVGRAFATPRRQGGRSAPNPCARRPAAVRAARPGSLLRRYRRRGPCGASLSARRRSRLVSARSRRAPAAGSPCSGIGATHSPLAASGGYGTAPPQPLPRQRLRTAPPNAPAAAAPPHCAS